MVQSQISRNRPSVCTKRQIGDRRLGRVPVEMGTGSATVLLSSPPAVTHPKISASRACSYDLHLASVVVLPGRQSGTKGLSVWGWRTGDESITHRKTSRCCVSQRRSLPSLCYSASMLWG